MDAYEQGRPSYPVEGLQYAFENLGLEDGSQRKVVDLAAGTGKLTRWVERGNVLQIMIVWSAHECEPVRTRHRVCITMESASIRPEARQARDPVSRYDCSLMRRLLVQNPGLDVVAVEPNEAMIGGFKKVLPDVPIIHAAAQQLPFNDNSVDAIFVGQVTVCQARLNHLNLMHACMPFPTCSLENFKGVPSIYGIQNAS